MKKKEANFNITPHTLTEIREPQSRLLSSNHCLYITKSANESNFLHLLIILFIFIVRSNDDGTSARKKRLGESQDLPYIIGLCV